jgi:hypothetical protein
MAELSEADKERQNIHLKAGYTALLLSPLYILGTLWIVGMMAAAWQMYQINKVVNAGYDDISGEINSSNGYEGGDE